MHSHAWPPECLCERNSPGHNYEEVQTVPRVSKVTFFTENPQGHHLYHHLDGEECKDEVIKVLQGERHAKCQSELRLMLVDKHSLYVMMDLHIKSF